MWCEENKIVNGLYFKQTCVISPEQYDVFLNEKYVAYVRCRYKHLTVCPILKDVIIPNVINITDHDYCNVMDSHNKIESCIDFNGKSNFLDKSLIFISFPYLERK